MLKNPPREKEWVSWLFVGLWTLIIFLTIPFARAIQKFVYLHWGRETFAYVVIGVVVAACAAGVIYLLRTRMTLRSYVWLLVISAIFVKYTIELTSPEESLHFIEYGLLGFLAYRATSHRIRDVSIYFVCAILCTIIGTIDELVQWLTPGRYWGLRDIWLNGFAGALTQVAIAKGLRPTLISRSLSAVGIRWLCRVSGIAVILLVVSFLNTPDRIATYSERYPFLAHLKNQQSMMFEYGYLYDDPDTGIFRSRLSPEELHRNDSERGAEAARILDRFHDNASYESFLKRYSPVTDPFIHEARVHLFRRDAYLINSKKHTNDEINYRTHLTVAYRENRILEKYFKNTLAQSSYVLSPEQIDMLEENLITDHKYESPVSKGLVTGVREWQVIGLLVVVLLGLAFVDIKQRN